MSVRMSFAPKGSPSSCATSCETPTFAMTNALGARSRTTAYVRRRLGSRNAARWLPTPIPRPCRAAASASVVFTRSAPEWPPVIPAITRGRARVWLRRRAERSTRAASAAGSASCNRCTSSQPGARVVSMSSSAAIRRYSALRRSIASRSGARLFEDAIALECAPFVGGEAEDLTEDVVVVRADGGTGTFLRARRRRQTERGRHQVHRANRRMRHRGPHRPVRELRVAEELRDREHRRGAKPPAAQERHDLVALARDGPGADALVELRTRSAAVRRGRRTVDARQVTELAPFLVAPHAERHPPVTTRAPIHAVRRSDGVGVAASSRYSSVRREFEDRRREELQPRLVLRKIDGAAGPGALAPLERREHGDRSVADGDIVDVRPVEKDGGRVGFAEQLNESGEGAQLAAISGVERVRPGLSLIAARQDDEPGVIR